MVAPVIAAMASQKPPTALTGDIWRRTTTREVGKGKNKRIVESTIHVNPIAIGVGVAAVGGAAALGLLGLWLAQRKVTTQEGKDLVRIVEYHEPTYKTVTIVDQPATTTTEEIEVLVSGGYSENTLVEYRCNVCDITYPADGTFLERFLMVHEHPELELPKPAIVPIYESVWIPAVYETREITVQVPAITHEEEVIDKAGYHLILTQRGAPFRRVVQDVIGPNEALTKGEQSRGYVFVEEFKTIKVSADVTRSWWRFHTDQGQTYGIGVREGSLFSPSIDVL